MQTTLSDIENLYTYKGPIERLREFLGNDFKNDAPLSIRTILIASSFEDALNSFNNIKWKSREQILLTLYFIKQINLKFKDEILLKGLKTAEKIANEATNMKERKEAFEAVKPTLSKYANIENIAEANFVRVYETHNDAVFKDKAHRKIVNDVIRAATKIDDYVVANTINVLDKIFLNSENLVNNAKTEYIRSIIDFWTARINFLYTKCVNFILNPDIDWMLGTVIMNDSVTAISLSVGVDVLKAGGGVEVAKMAINEAKENILISFEKEFIRMLNCVENGKLYEI